MMPFSYCCTTRMDFPAAISAAITTITMMTMTAAMSDRLLNITNREGLLPRLVGTTRNPAYIGRYLLGFEWRTVSQRTPFRKSSESHDLRGPARSGQLPEIASLERTKRHRTERHRMTARDTDWDGVRLHVVTGKGGTGKTTVAAALALALAHSGRKVLLIEAEGRQGIARIFDRPPLPYEERKIAMGPGGNGDGSAPGGDLYALSIDPEGALLDYLQMFYNMRSAGHVLTRLGMVDFATTIAPGLSDVLVTGKATEAARRRSGGGSGGGGGGGGGGKVYAYDAVVMDAPPTGRIGRFLNVSAEVSGLAKVGPVRAHADTVANVIKS